MAIPTVTETIKIGGTPVRGRVDIQLVASPSGGIAPGYALGADVTVLGTRSVPLVDGVWSAPMQPNTGSSTDVITTPAGTAYRLSYRLENVDATAEPVFIRVPDTAGTLQAADLIVAEPTSLVPSGTEAAIETALQAAITAAPSTFGRWPHGGFDVLPRDMVISTAVSFPDLGEMNWRRFTCPADMVVTGIQMATGTTAASGQTFSRLGLYAITPRSGVTNYQRETLTPLARTSNDTTRFTTINTNYAATFDTTGGWPSRVRLVSGQEYAVCSLLIGGTAPSLIGTVGLRAPANGIATLPLVGGRAAGMGAITDLHPYWTNNAWSFSNMAVAWSHLPCDITDVTTPRPLRTVLLGDSYFSSYAGWFGLANGQSGAKLIPVLNAGVGGETTTQMVARLTPVGAAAPEVIVLAGGLNDIDQGFLAPVAQANITTIINYAASVGSKLIICTPAPATTMSAGELVQLGLLRTWLLALSAPNVWVADTGMALTSGDGVTRNAALYVDSAHPNIAGQQAMANVLDDVIIAAAAA